MHQTGCLALDSIVCQADLCQPHGTNSLDGLENIRFHLSISGWLGIGIGFVVVGTNHTLWIAITGIAFAGLCGSVAHVSRATFIAARVPQSSLGRVYSVRSIISTIAITVGTLACGWLLEVWSAPHLIVIAGALITVMDATAILLLAGPVFFGRRPSLAADCADRSR